MNVNLGIAYNESSNQVIVHITREGVICGVFKVESHNFMRVATSILALLSNIITSMSFNGLTSDVFYVITRSDSHYYLYQLWREQVDVFTVGAEDIENLAGKLMVADARCRSK